MSGHSFIVDRIRRHGPIAFAEFMELALYHPEFGYYSGAPRRSGRSGDFYTSVDIGPVFGELLAERFVVMFRELLDRTGGADAGSHARLDLVEVGASTGRLSRDVLAALATRRDIYDRLRVHLVERSAAARAEHATVLEGHGTRLQSSGAGLPGPVNGIIFANELLDALPCHVVVARDDGLREIFVDVENGALVEREGPPSTPALADHLRAIGARVQPGFRAEVNLAATAFVRQAASAMTRGFIVLIDYGHEAPVLVSASHARGTLATFASHIVEVDDGGAAPPWLRDPGTRDITAHVNFTAIRVAALEAGLRQVSFAEQRHFLLVPGFERLLERYTGSERDAVASRLALKTLLMPGGLGSTHHVMVLAKNVF